MKKLFGAMGLGLTYFCIGTVLFQAVVVGMLWWKGVLADDRRLGMLAALRGVTPEAVALKNAKSSRKELPNQEEPSLEQLAQKRALASLDLTLRESAIDKSLVDLRNIESRVQDERAKLNQWKEAFDKKLEIIEAKTLDSSLLEVQRTLEAISPKQAKDQILKMLEDSPDGVNEKAMSDIVRIMKAMPLDKRRKVLAEFKSEKEADTLAEILKEIRLGLPDTELLRDSRTQLNQNQSTKR